MPARRPTIPARMEKLIWQEAHCLCALCHCDAVESLAVHHIRPWHVSPKHEFEHLILLCGTCHGRADAGQVTQDQLYTIKATFVARRSVVGVPRDAQNADRQSVVQISHGDAAINVSADSVTIRGGGRRSAAPRIAGTVSDDAFKVGYLQYLVSRFNAFKRWEVGPRRMNYVMIHTSYKRDLGFAVKTTPLERFEAAATYLQGRIANTKLGRILRKEDNRMFEPFAEFSPESSDPAAGVPAT